MPSKKSQNLSGPKGTLTNPMKTKRTINPKCIPKAKKPTQTKKQSEKKTAMLMKKATKKTDVTKTSSSKSKKKSDTKTSDESSEESEDDDPCLEWPALESNPEALTSYINGIGAAKSYQVYDVLQFDRDLLNQTIPGTIHALIFLFPAYAENGI